MILRTESNHINYQRIEQAILYLQQNFTRQPELEEIAEKVHLSPFHFQRIFTEWAGISPKRFLQYLTADYLKEKLQRSRNIEEAAAAAGLSSQSRVYDLFTTLVAVTPAEYKQRGAGIRIEYGFHETPFGHSLIGITERGICWFSFIQTGQDGQYALEEMKTSWYNSVFHENQSLTKDFIAQAFDSDSRRKPACREFGWCAAGRLHLFVKGTNFQVKVWEALLRIPPGALTTYHDIARKVDNPKAVQAVGSAVGANTIAYLIPCHRVIRKDGILGEYRWTSARKKSIIGWEMARHDTPNNH